MSKRYNEEFKKDAVNLACHSDKATTQIAKDLGMASSTLFKWVDHYAGNGSDSSKNIDFEKEVKNLKKEVSILKMERDILKMATAFFAKES
jgi:transposase